MEKGLAFPADGYSSTLHLNGKLTRQTIQELIEWSLKGWRDRNLGEAVCREEGAPAGHVAGLDQLGVG